LKTVKSILLIILICIHLVPTIWALQIERPSTYEFIDKVIAEGNTTDNAGISMAAHIYEYTPQQGPPYGHDFLNFNISVLANTRKALTYNFTILNELKDWVFDAPGSQYYQEFVNCGDDWGTWVDLPDNFRFLFYGAKYRNLPAEKDVSKVWICSNGYVSFDNSNSTNPIPPSGLCDPNPPNAFIAPLWADLLVDAEAKITTTRRYHSPNEYFVVMWKNVLHKSSGQRLTFSLALEAYDAMYDDAVIPQGHIYMGYQSVVSVDKYYIWGISDHEGRKGSGVYEPGANLGWFNGKTVTFYQNSPNYCIRRVNLYFEDQYWQNARYEIVQETMRGYGLRIHKGEEPSSNEQLMFLKTILSAVGLGLSGTSALASVAGLAFPPTLLITLPLSAVLVAWGAYDWYVRHQYNLIEWASLQENPIGDPMQSAHLKVPAMNDFVFDSSLNVGFLWLLTDGPSSYHNLTLKAELEYSESPGAPTHTVTTSIKVDLSQDNNDSFPEATALIRGCYGNDPMLWLGYDDPEDYYKVCISNAYRIEVEINVPPIDTDFDLYLYDPYYSLRAASEQRGDNKREFISYCPDLAGYWYIKVKRYMGHGFYNMTIATLGQGGACPTLFIWNGSTFVEEALLDIHAESDITLQHSIQNPLTPEHGVCKLQLRELDNYTSHIDQVKLYAVDYQGQYHQGLLFYAKHNELGFVTSELWFDDNIRIDMTPTQTVDLKFLSFIPYDATAHYVFEITGYNRKDW